MINLITSQLKRKVLLLLVTSLFLSQYGHAAEEKNSDFIVVMNAQEDDETFSKQQIRHIFMGGALSHKFIAVNLPSGNYLRIEFNTKIVGLTESRIQAYWAQMKFTGRSKPPMELDTPEEALQFIAKTEGAIAYLPAGIEIPNSLTVIYP